jgi:cell division protein FtsL
MNLEIHDFHKHFHKNVEIPEHGHQKKFSKVCRIEKMLWNMFWATAMTYSQSAS